MTLEEAKDFSEDMFPEIGKQVFTPESLVRHIYDAVCIENNGQFEVYGDGILIGSSTMSPVLAWVDSAENLPSMYLRGFSVIKHPNSVVSFYKREEEVGEDQKSS